MLNLDNILKTPETFVTLPTVKSLENPLHWLEWQKNECPCSVSSKHHKRWMNTYLYSTRSVGQDPVINIPDDQLPKQVPFSQFTNSHCSRGGQKKRFKNTLKAKLKKCNINVGGCNTGIVMYDKIDHFRLTHLTVKGNRWESIRDCHSHFQH